MPSTWNRHPRYLLLIALVISATVYLLIPSQPSISSDSFASLVRDTSLPARLQRAERVYQKVISDRKDMIRKYGQTSRNIHMFPPDKDPWPAYTAWSFFPPAFDCPHEVERIGALGDGGKWACGVSRLDHKPDCIIYTFGMYYETTFEAEMLERTQYCQVWGYDYRSNSFGSSKLNNYRAHFFPYALAHVDTHGPHDEQKLYTLKTLMEMNKHTHIDILKIDLLIEIHTWDKKFDDFLSWWELLEAAGLRPFMTEVNLVYQNYNRGKSTDLAEYSFINIRGNNIFISDPPTTSTGATIGSE
ncbi:methyltransferase domain-containing protein [Pisolithus marmoratus]|nr:methyltransferase domain-containing protein [Pisolithus marmoratus]